MNEDKNLVEEIAKTMVKKKVMTIALSSLSFLLPFFLILFTLFVSVFIVLVLFDFDSQASGGISSNNFYNNECNYEDTKVVVMDGSNTKILATVSLEDYIIGVACVEIGACNGASSFIDSEYVKAQYVASKTFALSNGNYNASTKTITIMASTRNQQWCDLDTGCIVTKESDSIYHNTYPGNYDDSQIVGTIISTHKFTENDLATFHGYYAETYGDLILSMDYKDKVYSLNYSTIVHYKSDTQLFWKAQAGNGLKYDSILTSTAFNDVSNKDDYSNKIIYKLGNYCENKNNYNNYGGNTNINYVNWMIDFASDDAHGYSMNNRNMSPDVDCSSFVYYALLNNGYNVSQLGGYPFTTASMENILKFLGFEKYPYNPSALQVGDILWYPAGFKGHKYGHTEVYIGDGKTVGAHSNYDGITGDSSGREVSVVSVGEYQSFFRKR